ncbi:flagellar basal-body rod protein FlgG [Halanaerobium saccharolyticum]|uniref:Flagellar basal-body rod protein FlgG n=1 Tax=Halanaerobium saccharolyticum TaxID=43595 RepID=A0A4R6M1Q4_9FIRM|nr:flagellar basal-body rod protein FlgG [Halanaerobium saccharolyticum]TDO94485.1 flagellar basal-body rod protein FlgG [Halanaerobium saccharolyticum]
MISALWTSATGMNAQQTNINVISNNLANVNTGGFKKSKINFADLIYTTMREPGTPNAQGAEIPTGIEIGHGSKVNSTQKIFTQGNIKNTDSPLDMVIEGDGFFRIQLPDGNFAYSRDGSFKQDSNGNIVTSDGYQLVPPIQINPEATEISITSDGMVNLKVNGENQQVGQIELYRFSNPAGLSSEGRNLYTETVASGAAMAGIPGESGFGTITQGFLEMSNVKVVEEMVNMIAAQRAYETNSKSIQAADEMLQTANQLKR